MVIGGYHPSTWKKMRKHSTIKKIRTPAVIFLKLEMKLAVVIINGAAKEIGRAAVTAVTRARGMEVAGSVDSYLVGEDIGKATAFGMRSVVYVPKIKLDTVSALSALCDKASIKLFLFFAFLPLLSQNETIHLSLIWSCNCVQGCLIAPTLSIGSILLQQAAISASFHYNNVEIVESRASATDFPSSDATQIANNLSNLGQIYNREDISTDVLARGQVLGDGVRVLSTTVHFSRLGEVYSLKHDITDVQCLMPGLLLAIRNIVRIKNLVYNLQKFL
ncbi:dihydrodipicolinate reductase-like protein CRR1, chloroplastic [Malus sylvestris]|uniref:dihydrodipicolinate reductase-like protein CRR1, chloroplastic n=1 Tax=Malus sylvestris TaxID=3752 RepID=UPI0021AB9C0C|nr:dihydrodipicolinate reductase-like protein CRR1, chloroplastic [Malus sylvestris]